MLLTTLDPILSPSVLPSVLHHCFSMAHSHHPSCEKRQRNYTAGLSMSHVSSYELHEQPHELGVMSACQLQKLRRGSIVWHGHIIRDSIQNVGQSDPSALPSTAPCSLPGLRVTNPISSLNLNLLNMSPCQTPVPITGSQKKKQGQVYYNKHL